MKCSVGKKMPKKDGSLTIQKNQECTDTDQEEVMMLLPWKSSGSVIQYKDMVTLTWFLVFLLPYGFIKLMAGHIDGLIDWLRSIYFNG